MTAFGPYGQDPYGRGPDAFPAAPRNLSVRPGLEGPQVVLTWDAPVAPLRGLAVRRKLREFPRDVTDGTLVRLDLTTPNDLVEVVDLGSDLLPEAADEGEGQWWYYRLFVMPAPLPLDEQFAGLGFLTLTPTLAQGAPSSPTWDVQDRAPVEIYLHAGDLAATAYVWTAAEVDGPWTNLDIIPLEADQAWIWHHEGALKYLRVTVTDGPVHIALSASLTPEWVTGPTLSMPVYAYRGGRHRRLAEEQCLPEFYLEADTSQPQVSLFEGDPDDGEAFNLGETGRARGPLWRYLSAYLVELDRVDAYLRSLRPYLPDLDRMPPHLFAHVATVLGYPLEVDGRNYGQVRDEMFRIASVWKTAGTARQLRAACSQILGVRPRVQEGAGRVFRVADPDLYGVTQNVAE